MPDILHRIIIPAEAHRVYEMVHATEGLKHWWTQDAAGGTAVGEMLELGFNGRKAVLQMRIDELLPDRISWTCLYHAGGMEEWPGTRLIWTFAPWKSVETDLRFTHANWKTVIGEFPACNTMWGQLLLRLKSAAMGRAPGALFY